MGLHDRPTDGQPHPQPLRFGADEALEDLLHLGFLDTDSGVADRDGDASHLGLAGVDPDLTRAARSERNGLPGVDDQVQDDLSELDGVSEHGWQRLPAGEAHHDVLALYVVPEQPQHVLDQRVDVDRGVLGVLLAEQSPQSADRLRSPVGVPGDVDEGVFDVPWLRLLDRQEPARRLGVRHDRAQGLVDLVGK